MSDGEGSEHTLTSDDEALPPPTAEQRQQVNDGLTLAQGRLEEYAASHPKILSAVFRCTDLAAEGREIYAAVDRITALARHINPPEHREALMRCRDVFNSGANLLLCIDGWLAGIDPDFINTVDADEIASFMADVAALPPEPGRIQTSIEGLTHARDIRPTTRAPGSLIPGLLDRGGLALVYGPSNSGKSFFAIDAALCLASGQPWRGRTLQQAACLFAAVEDPDGVEARFNAWKMHMDVEYPAFSILRRPLDLTTAAAADDLLRCVDAAQACHLLPVRLIVVDTTARAIGTADETSGSAMAALLGNIDRIRRETGAAVLMVHHSARKGSAPRGHTALPNAADLRINVEDGVALVERIRGAQEGEAFPFGIVSVPGAGGHGVIEHLAEAPPRRRAVKPKATEPDPMTALVAAVRRSAADGQPFKLHGDGGLFQRRADLTEPLASMGRNALVALGQSAIKEGAVIINGGVLSVPQAH